MTATIPAKASKSAPDDFLLSKIHAALVMNGVIQEKK